MGFSFSKKDVFLLLSVGLVLLIIFLNLGAPLTQPQGQVPVPIGVNETNQTNQTGTTQVQYVVKTDPLGWYVVVGLLLFIFWRERSQGKKGYANEQEAINDLRTRMKALDVFPLVIKQFRFADENKNEAEGTFICQHEAFPEKNSYIKFEIRKDGYLTYDPRVFRKSFEDKKKPKIIVREKRIFGGREEERR